MEKQTKRKPSGAAALGAGPGRPKGIPNKVTTEFRDTVRQLLEDNAGNVGIWIAQVANGHPGAPPDPAKALDLLAKLAEYAAPKLGRIDHTSSDGSMSPSTEKGKDLSDFYADHVPAKPKPA